MANKTLIPAFKARVGDWSYYICVMKYAEVARQVGFVHELGGNKDLETMLQRGLSSRTNEIKDYLVRSPHRFLGSLIVAAWGGDPEYSTMAMEDPDEVLKGIDRGFGVLTFDGTQQYIALDGQHRLRAIKDALRSNPELGSEDICVLLVSHYDTVDGREKTRRLFTNINKNAQATKASENIALDEDDGFSIIVRRLLQEHKFLSVNKRVKVFNRVGDNGELKLASGSVAKTDPYAFTTIVVLHDILTGLGFDLKGAMLERNTRPTDDELEKGYRVLAGRIDDLLKFCGDLSSLFEENAIARDIRAPKGQEENGHPFMRPVVQKAIARVLGPLLDQERATWDELMKRLSELPWKLGKAPWLAVFNPETGKMLSGKDFNDVLMDLLRVHLAPANEADIKRARSNYKKLRGVNYPVSLEKLKRNLPDLAD